MSGFLNHWIICALWEYSQYCLSIAWATHRTKPDDEFLFHAPYLPPCCQWFHEIDVTAYSDVLGTWFILHYKALIYLLCSCMHEKKKKRVKFSKAFSKCFCLSYLEWLLFHGEFGSCRLPIDFIKHPKNTESWQWRTILLEILILFSRKADFSVTTPKLLPFSVYCVTLNTIWHTMHLSLPSIPATLVKFKSIFLILPLDVCPPVTLCHTS